MDNRLSILEKETLKLIATKKAKPNKTIEEHILDLLSVLDELLELGYIKDERIYNLTKLACIYHDIGKIPDNFQERVMSEKKIKFNPEKEVPHNVLSLYFMNQNIFKDKEDFLKVAHAVINHHNYCDVFDTIENKQAIIQDSLEKFSYHKVKRATARKISVMCDDMESVLIKGYLHKCDYSASGEFVAEYRNDYLNHSMGNILNKWRSENESADWNDLQNFCKNHTNDNILAIAQTGMGKTEAGLLWMDDNKGFFVLPIKTAINAIYDRIRCDILNNKDIDSRLAILHSGSLEYYLKNLNTNNDARLDLIEYQKMGKRLSIPLNVSTMDQLFDFVYKYNGYELKLTTLSYSKIVIDEIQMYGPDLLAYLIYGIEQVVSYGGKVAILTATLPPFVRDLLKKNIDFKISKSEFINDSVRHSVKVLDKRINAKDIYDKYKHNKLNQKMNKILVVCNSITESQRIYRELEELFAKDKDISEDTNLLHSKFIKKDRASKELEIIEFGKTFNDKGEIDCRNGIWISTSIVEASLDIDFDYLFTELLDLNSLFQRLGRCNRKGLKMIIGFNCYVYTDIKSNYFISGDKGFIDKTIFDLSKEAISSCEGPITERLKIDLIEEYLTTEKLKKSNYITKYKEVYESIANIRPYSFEQKDVDLRNILSEDIIPYPVYKENYNEIKNIEKQLKGDELSKEEVIKLKDKLKDFTVSVYTYEIGQYRKAIYKGLANDYGTIRLSDYEQILVMDCNYDELGYSKKKYDEPK